MMTGKRALTLQFSKDTVTGPLASEATFTINKNFGNSPGKFCEA